MHALQRIDPKYGSAVQCVRHVSLGAAAGAAVCRRARATAPAPLQDAAARCRCRASTTSATATISSSSTTTTTTTSSADHNRRAALGGLVSAAAALAVGLPAPRPAAAAEGDACTPTTAPSGLIWCDLQQGDGPTPLRGAFYKAHYRASLGSNATEFDSSYAKKTPMIFKVGEREVMEAWDVAILGDDAIPPMREGGRRRIVVPPGRLQQQGTKSLVWMVGMLDALEEAGELSGDGTPTADLVFEIELLKRRVRG